MLFHWIEFAVVGVYLLFLIAIGFAFKRMNTNVDDYFRSGCQGTWWLVGMSSFMAGAGSGTFVAGAWTAYEYGFTSYFVSGISALGALIPALWLASWYRQLRLVTGPDVIKERFGVGLEQFYAYTGVVLVIWGSAIQLWAVSMFCSSMFGFDLATTIVVCGLIVLTYSTVGGKWAVMGTDFIQGLILIPITFLVGFICLHKMGGISGMLELVEAKGLSQQWSPFKAKGEVDGNFFTLPYYMAYGILLTSVGCNLGAAQKYFAVKDGREAKLSAWVFVILYSIGALIWALPAFAGRLLFEAQVMASPLERPGEGAFAVVSREVLPLGLTGLMMTAMMAAAMSTLDSGINGNAAQIIRNLYPPLCRLFGRIPREGKRLLDLSRDVSIISGLSIITVGLIVAAWDIPFFIIFSYFSAIFGMPMGMPLIMGLFIRRTPPWSGFLSMFAAAIPSVITVVVPKIYGGGTGGQGLDFHEIVLLVFAFGAVTFIGTIPFYKYSGKKHRDRIEAMFKRMDTPVNFEEEVGNDEDASQMKIMGKFSLAVSAFILSLVVIPNPLSGRLQIAGMAASVAAVAALLLVAAWRREKKDRQLAAEAS